MLSMLMGKRGAVAVEPVAVPEVVRPEVAEDRAELIELIAIEAEFCRLVEMAATHHWDGRSVLKGIDLAADDRAGVIDFIEMRRPFECAFERLVKRIVPRDERDAQWVREGARELLALVMELVLRWDGRKDLASIACVFNGRAVDVEEALRCVEKVARGQHAAETARRWLAVYARDGLSGEMGTCVNKVAVRLRRFRSDE